MRFERAFIPLGYAWSSPSVRWQGSLSDVNSMDLAHLVTARALADRGVDPARVSELVLGSTVPQSGGFYGAPTLAARLGADHATGPVLCPGVRDPGRMSAAALRPWWRTTRISERLELVVATDRSATGRCWSFPVPQAPAGQPRPKRECWITSGGTPGPAGR